MAVLLLLVLLFIVLLWKRHSREVDKASTVSTHPTITNAVFEVNEPVYEIIPDMVASETSAAIRSQHDETHGEEDYLEILSQHDATYENEDDKKITVTIQAETHNETHSNEAYQLAATADPTECIETHGNEAYQTTATADSMECIETHGNEAYQTTATAISNVACCSQMDNEDDYL